MPVSPLKLVKEFFHTEARPMTLKEMKDEWTNGGLTPKDKDQITQGLTDGTLTY